MAPHVVQPADRERLGVTIHMDYAFMTTRANEEHGHKEVKILVMKDSKSKYTFSVPVPAKGVDDNHWAVKR